MICANCKKKLKEEEVIPDYHYFCKKCKDAGLKNRLSIAKYLFNGKRKEMDIRLFKEWVGGADLVMKIIKKKILTKKEAKMLINIFGGDLCNYIIGDPKLKYKIIDRLEKWFKRNEKKYCRENTLKILNKKLEY